MKELPDLKPVQDMFDRGGTESSQIKIPNRLRKEYGSFVQPIQALITETLTSGIYDQRLAARFINGYIGCRNEDEVRQRTLLLENIAHDIPLLGEEYDQQKVDVTYRALNNALGLENRLNPNTEDVKKKLQLAFFSSEDQSIGKVFVAKPDNPNHWVLYIGKEGKEDMLLIDMDTTNGRVLLTTTVTPTTLVTVLADVQTDLKRKIFYHSRLDIITPENSPLIRRVNRAEVERTQNTRIMKAQEALHNLPSTEVAWADHVYEGEKIMQSYMGVHRATEGAYGTHELFNCVVMTGRGTDSEGNLLIGLAHADAGQELSNRKSGIVHSFKELFVEGGVREDEIELFMVTNGILPNRVLQTIMYEEDPDAWKGAAMDIDVVLGMRMPRPAMDVVIDTEGKTWYGINNKIFQERKK